MKIRILFRDFQSQRGLGRGVFRESRQDVRAAQQSGAAEGAFIWMGRQRIQPRKRNARGIQRMDGNAHRLGERRAGFRTELLRFASGEAALIEKEPRLKGIHL